MPTGTLRTADRDPPAPFHLAVVAACGLDAPDLDSFLDALLLKLTTRHRHRPISVATVIGEPTCRTVAEVCRRRGWLHSLHDPHPAGRRDVAVLRESVAALLRPGRLSC